MSPGWVDELVIDGGLDLHTRRSAGPGAQRGLAAAIQASPEELQRMGAMVTPVPESSTLIYGGLALCAGLGLWLASVRRKSDEDALALA